MRMLPRLAVVGLLLAAACSDGGTGPLVPETVEAVAVAPDSVEMMVGGSEVLAVTVYGRNGRVLEGRTVVWTMDVGDVVSVDAAGVVTALAEGTARLTATSEGKFGRATVVVLPAPEPLTIQTESLPEAVQGEEYGRELEALGGSGEYSWALSAGSLPSGLTLSPAGTISGTPVGTGTSSFHVRVMDGSAQQATRELSIVVRAPLAVAAISLPTATQGRAYAAQLVATGGDGVYMWSLESGAVPTGVELTTGGALIGTPTEGGDHAFTVQVTDGAGRVATRSLSITVEPAPTIQTGSLPTGEVGTPYAAQLRATGGTGDYTWSVIQGALPDGLSLSPGGTISGTPTTEGSSSFTVRVMDEAAATDSRAFTLVVAPVEVLSNGVAVNGIAGEAGSARHYLIEVPQRATRLTVSISGGTGDVDLYVRHGALPQAFVYDCRPLRLGNDETCTFTPPAAGSWYIMLRGYADYAGVTLVATFEE